MCHHAHHSVVAIYSTVQYLMILWAQRLHRQQKLIVLRLGFWENIYYDIVTGYQWIRFGSGSKNLLELYTALV